MPYILWLDRIKEGDFNLVGGKAYNLGIMFGLGLPVPEGFAVTTEAFDDFLRTTGLRDKIYEIVSNLNVDDTEQLLKASQEIKASILSQEMPEKIKAEIVEAYNSLSFYDKIVDERLRRLISAGREFAIVAARSSATSEDLPTASFAGQHATFLNVKGVKELLEAVKQCWASLYEPRAMFYRAKHGITQISISVVVQRMVSADKSGVMFTKDPVTGEDNIVIEACWGLGETLVQGEVEPDLYVLSKDGKLLSKKIGKKAVKRVRDLATDKTVVLPVHPDFIEAQVLTEDEIRQLATFGIILEQHYNHPQDIEFAIEKSKVYIVQTRAVTTEGKKEEKKVEGEPLVKGLAASPGVATGPVRIVHGLEDAVKVQAGDVLVTKMTSPDLVPSMSKCVAIVTDEGGMNAHAAIVAREMGIPCIVGTKNATAVLKDGQMITVDAYNGVVFGGKVEVEKPKEEEKPFFTSTVTAVKVNVAFALPKLEEIAARTDGVGLLRIEHMITKYGVHPAKLIKEGKKEEYVKILTEGIKPIAKAFEGKPVWVRTLDARTDEFRNLQGGEDEAVEANPMLGWHGIRRSLDEPELLRAEFEAIKMLHEEGYTNVHVMLPFVISADEFNKAKEIANEVGLPYTVRMGIMVETVGAALTIEEFCKAGIDFASIGSNDLTMLALGVDRNNAKIASLYSEFHPAVLKLMKHVIEVCNSYDVESSICGESGSNPEMVKKLVKLGIRSISCNIDAIDKVRMAVAEAERELVEETKRRKIE